MKKIFEVFVLRGLRADCLARVLFCGFAVTHEMEEHACDRLEGFRDALRFAVLPEGAPPITFRCVGPSPKLALWLAHWAEDLSHVRRSLVITRNFGDDENGLSRADFARADLHRTHAGTASTTNST